MAALFISCVIALTMVIWLYRDPATAWPFVLVFFIASAVWSYVPRERAMRLWRRLTGRGA